jgi:hypothetical protein
LKFLRKTSVKQHPKDGKIAVIDPKLPRQTHLEGFDCSKASDANIRIDVNH